ncbi:oxaloacetate decarboxylase [Flavobacteriaceae bacterium UJ101]|nr:oxaloacetate decarboxylase [Flavobacteriaceae bacterium UJ101]
MELKDIHNLIKFVSKSGVKEVDLEFEDVKIKIKNESEKTVYQQVPVQQPVAPVQQPVAVAPAVAPEVAPATPVAEKESTSENNNYIEIKSPMIGTFYRKPGPEKEPFVKVGDEISENSVVCMIEAMKLFNDIEAEVSGKVVKVLVDDATPVEYDQPLFLIDPS